MWTTKKNILWYGVRCGAIVQAQVRQPVASDTSSNLKVPKKFLKPTHLEIVVCRWHLSSYSISYSLHSIAWAIGTNGFSYRMHLIFEWAPSRSRNYKPQLSKINVIFQQQTILSYFFEHWCSFMVDYDRQALPNSQNVYLISTYVATIRTRISDILWKECTVFRTMNQTSKRVLVICAGRIQKEFR